MHKEPQSSSRAVPWLFAALGSAIFILLHVLISINWAHLRTHGGESWFLNSGGAMRLMVLGMVIASLLAGVLAGQTHRLHWLAALSFWGGATATMIVVLFVIGPGNLWPIVTALGSVLLATAIALGMGIAFFLNLLRSRVR